MSCCMFQPVDVRFIEYMPFGGNRWNFKRMVSYQQMLDMIRDKWPDFERLSDGPNDTSKVCSFHQHQVDLYNDGVHYMYVSSWLSVTSVFRTIC